MFLGCSPCCGCLDYSEVPHRRFYIEAYVEYSHSSWSLWDNDSASFFPAYPGFSASAVFQETFDMSVFDQASWSSSDWTGIIFRQTFPAGQRNDRRDGSGTWHDVDVLIDLKVRAEIVVKDNTPEFRFLPSTYGVYAGATYSQVINRFGTLPNWYLAWDHEPCGSNNRGTEFRRFLLNSSQDKGSLRISKEITFDGTYGNASTFDQYNTRFYQLTGDRTTNIKMDSTDVLSYSFDESFYPTSQELAQGATDGQISQHLEVTVRELSFVTEDDERIPVPYSWLDNTEWMNTVAVW